jgi:hypothetical protein
MTVIALSAACVDRGVVGMRDASSAAPPLACEPACAESEHCLLEEARCVECIEDADCSASAEGAHCDLALHVCAPCPAGESCEPSCEDDDDDEPFDDDDDDCDEADGGDDDDGFPDL